MAVERGLVPISFGLGIDTKTDPKQQLLTTFRKAKNVVYETIYSVRKRFGYTAINLVDSTGQQINDAQQTTAFKNELGVLTEAAYYSYSPTAERLANKGPIYKVFSETTPVINHVYSVRVVDVAIVDGLIITIYSNSNFEVRYSVQDSTNNAFLVSNDLVTANGEKPKVAVIGGTVFLFYTNLVNQLRFRKFEIATPSTLSADTVLAGDVHSTNNAVDVQSKNDSIYLCYNSTTSTSLRVLCININGTILQAINVTGSGYSNNLTVFVDANNRVVLTYNGRYCVVNADFSGFSCINVVFAATAVNVGILEISSGIYKFWYGSTVAVTTVTAVSTATVTAAGSITSPAAFFILGVGLCSRPYQINGQNFIPVVFASEIQSSYFVLDNNAKVVCRFLTGQAQSTSSSFILPHTPSLSAAKVIVAAAYKTRLQAVDLTFFSVFGAANTVVSHEPTTPLQTATLGENLHIAGGVLRAYDGDQIVEHGFHTYPETCTVVSVGTAGSIPPGTYFYNAVYKWTDNYGQEHRSAASADGEATIVSTAKQVELSIPTLKITDKTEVLVELYRTEIGGIGDVSYLVGSVINNPLVANVTITDNLTDAQIISRQPLYTTGGVLDNGPAPSGRVIGTHTASNRLFMATDDGLSLFYSKIRNQGQPVEWNEALVTTLDPIGGKVTALTSMDDKLIIFKTDAILYISGGGPNNLGQQDTFTSPERVSIDVGCIEPQSVVLTAEGLMFKSRKGIYLLTRSLGIDYVGSAVEEYNDLQITSAEFIGQYNQVRFTTKTGDCLVYNYYLKLWSTFDNHQALSAKSIGNDYYYVRSSNQLYKEVANQYSDNGSPIAILIETGWMSFAKLQGFQRAYKMLVLGDWKSAHNLRVRASYDFNNAWVNEKVLNPVPGVVSGIPYGGSSPYGSQSPYGGDGDVYQARFDFKKQKCQSVRLQFQEQQNVATEGLSLSAFTLEVGGKRGMFKPSQAKIKGLS